VNPDQVVSGELQSLTNYLTKLIRMVMGIVSVKPFLGLFSLSCLLIVKISFFNVNLLDIAHNLVLREENLTH
jgi:hypothetical protein